MRIRMILWLGKGACYHERLLPALKAKALAEGFVVNADETWCRLHLLGKSGKKYIWCLVNKLYLDDKLLGIDHIYCLAHARAKFKYAQEQGGDDRATAILELIAELYRLERE